MKGGEEKMVDAQEKIEDKQSLSVSSYSVSFGDLSNLESLVNDADEKISKKGLNVEHFSEMKKIIKKIKNSKNSE